MKTSLRRIHTQDNLELVGLLYEPDAPTTKILVHVHGMAGNFYENAFLDAIAETLTKSGVAFFAFNNRGCELIKDLRKIEGSTQSFVRIGNAYEIFEDSAIDIQTAIDFVRAQGFSEIHLSGHSLGTSKIAYYATRGNDHGISSLLFLAPSDMVGLIRQEKNYEREVAEARKMVSEGRGGELIPFPVLWDQSPLSANTYLSLGGAGSAVAIFNFYDPSDPLSALSTIAVPALAVMGKKDDALVVPVEETMDRIKKAMTTSPRVETIILGDADHQYHGYEQQVADTVCEWICH